MKRLIILTLVISALCCNTPEDKATGNPEKKNFNHEEDTKLNTATDLDNTNANRLDTSRSPATSKENSNSTTKGTNRSYGTTGDSAKHK